MARLRLSLNSGKGVMRDDRHGLSDYCIAKMRSKLATVELTQRGIVHRSRLYQALLVSERGA